MLNLYSSALGFARVPTSRGRCLGLVCWPGGRGPSTSQWADLPPPCTAALKVPAECVPMPPHVPPSSCEAGQPTSHVPYQHNPSVSTFGNPNIHHQCKQPGFCHLSSRHLHAHIFDNWKSCGKVTLPPPPDKALISPFPSRRAQTLTTNPPLAVQLPPSARLHVILR